MNEEAFTPTIDGTVCIVDMHVAQPEDRAAVNERLKELLGRETVTSYVAVDDTDGPVSSERFEDIERLSAFAARNGIERIALVGEGVKTIAIEGTVDHPDLEVDRFEDRAAAVDWVRDG